MIVLPTYYTYSHPPNIKHTQNGPNKMWKFLLNHGFETGVFFFFRGKGLGTDELPDTVSLNCSSMIFTDVLIG